MMSTSQESLEESLDPVVIEKPLLNSIPEDLVARFDPVYVQYYNRYSAGRLATHQISFEDFAANPAKYAIAYGRDRVSGRGIKISDQKCPVDGGEITVRVYERDSARSTQSPRPVYVNYHGGGWVFGGLPTDFDFCKRIVQHLDCVVFDVDYRLAPRNPYPIPVDDSISALQWVSHIQ